jgi:hypothetical protein
LTVIFIAPPLQVPMVEGAYACVRGWASTVHKRAGLLARAVRIRTLGFQGLRK